MPKAGSITREMAMLAVQLRRESATWAEIGRLLALMAKRQVAFTDRTVERAVKRYIAGEL